ncbi:hypothetical protein [Aliikangiella sp. G2MR2-5]|uniref:hypothetical protein n=1 Tax=Aliikangiella sp. G2MR2-5 TaxID=2788943 RepID=UPI0018A89E1C|nr:hypothetical protein [Aliikangiella sp. G2MR2-5]
MSTVCKIYVASDDVEKINSYLEEYLQKEYSCDTESIETEWPLATEFDSFNSGDETPTIYSYKREGSLVEIYFNSFSENEDLAKHLSQELKTITTVSIYQSTAESGCWLYFSSGEKIRHILFMEGSPEEIHGDRLSFENNPIGHNIGEESDPYYVFDLEEIDFYNESIGIAIPMYNEPKPDWVNIRVKTITPSLQKENKKPWWKLW